MTYWDESMGIQLSDCMHGRITVVCLYAGKVAASYAWEISDLEFESHMKLLLIFFIILLKTSDFPRM